MLTDRILKEFVEGLLTGTLLIDLQKNFDIIDHEILPQMPQAIRFSKETMQWFRSYHSESILKLSSQILKKNYFGVS